jgi:YfiH family protein
MLLSSALLTRHDFAHGFFTRRGGVSGGLYASLNFAASTGDDPANVRENVSRAASALRVTPARLYFLSQVHGTTAVRLGGADPREDLLVVEGDATFSTIGGVACGVRSADCGTILIGDRTTGAALAIHAGWRGTELGVVESAVMALRQALGDAGDLIAAVGPLIETCCFEVGRDVAERLAAVSAVGEGAIDRQRSKPHVDLRRILGAKLEALGLSDDAIDHVRGCTVCDPERFFSYRRDGKASGRLLSAIVARD